MRRHPNKGKHWVYKKYFQQTKKGGWNFFSKTTNRYGQSEVMSLINMGYIPIERHIKVCGDAGPDNPTLQEYWQKRQQRNIGITRMTAFWDNDDVRKRTV